MTTPGGPTTPKNNWFAIGAGGTARAKLENRTESVMTGLYKDDQKPGIDTAFSGFNGGLIGVLTRVFTGSGGGILAAGLQFLQDLFSLRWAQVDDVDNRSSNIITSLFNTWFGIGPPQAGQVAQVMASIKSAVYSGVNVYTLQGDGSFVIPECKSLLIVVINGGQGGQSGDRGGGANGQVRPGGAGGTNGGFIAQEFSVTDLGGVGATIQYSTGVAGAGGSNSVNYQLGGMGGITRFGPPTAAFITGRFNIAALGTRGAFVPTTSQPGNGGSGGGYTQGQNVSYNGNPGGDTPLALGGAAGSGGGSGGNGSPGSPGVDALTSLSLAGGGGGGGGGGAAGFGTSAAPGAAGGKYGAGGGGGGSDYNNPTGAGGNGAPGVIYIIAQ